MDEEKEKSTRSYILTGILWGLLTLFFVEISDYFMFDRAIKWKKILISIPIWVVAGIGFGYINRYSDRKNKKKEDQK